MHEAMMKHRSEVRRWSTLLLLVAVPLATGAPITLSNSESLAFGKFAAGTGGSVLVSTSGARSATGGVVLLSSGPGAAARFQVSGDANLTYAITLPANDSASLTNGSGQSMSLTDFSSSPASTGQLNAMGSQTLSVGARLNVGANQPSGSYSGSFVVYVDYN
jgi:hypothetical protein